MSDLLRRPGSVPALFSAAGEDMGAWRYAAMPRRRPRPAAVVSALFEEEIRRVPLRTSRRFAALAGSLVLAFEYPFLKAAAALLGMAIPR